MKKVRNVHLALPHFPYEYPNQPKASSQEDHEDIKDEIKETVVILFLTIMKIYRSFKPTNRATIAHDLPFLGG